MLALVLRAGRRSVTGRIAAAPRSDVLSRRSRWWIVRSTGNLSPRRRWARTHQSAQLSGVVPIGARASARSPRQMDGKLMFVTVIHRIRDPEGFQAAEAKALEAGLP